MKHYGNHQANRRTGSCLQGGVPFLWLPDKPPTPGIKLTPDRSFSRCHRYKDLLLRPWTEEARIKAPKIICRNFSISCKQVRIPSEVSTAIENSTAVHLEFKVFSRHNC